MVIEQSDKITTIRLTFETKDRLAELGAKDETYEDIIKRLLDEHDSQSK